MGKEGIEMEVFRAAVAAAFADKSASIAEVNVLYDQLAEGASAIILRHSRRLRGEIAGYRELADMHVYSRDRELIGDLLGALTDECEALEKIALMVSPRKERA